jgi:hypothetical protein
MLFEHVVFEARRSALQFVGKTELLGPFLKRRFERPRHQIKVASNQMARLVAHYFVTNFDV